MPPHGVGVDVAQVVDVGNVLAAGVAAPGHQARLQRRLPLRQVLAHPLQQVGAIGVVVAADVVIHAARLGGGPGTLEQQVHGGARGLVVGVFVAVDVAAPGVVEVGKVELVRAHLLHQVEQRGQVVGVHGGHGVAQAHFHAYAVEVANGGQAAVKRAFQAAEFVVRGLEAIEADANVVKPGVGNALRQRGIDQRAVGGQAGVKAHAARACGNLKNVFAQQRLAPREDERGHAKGFEVVHDGEDLGQRQLARVVMVGREGVAVLAGEVAAANEVPDNHRPARLAVVGAGVLAAGLGLHEFTHVLADSEHGAALFRQSRQSFKRRPVFFKIALEYKMSWLRQALPSSSAISWACCSTAARLVPCSMANRL